MTVLRPLFFSRGSLSARTERRGRRTLPQSRHAPQKAGVPVPFPPDSALFSKKECPLHPCPLRATKFCGKIGLVASGRCSPAS